MSQSKTITSKTIAIKTVIKPKEGTKMFTRPVRHLEKQTTSQGNTTLVSMQPIDCLPGTEDRQDRIGSNKETIETFQLRTHKLEPKFQTTNASFSLRSCMRQTADHKDNNSTHPRCCLTAASGVQFKNYS